MKDLAIKLKKEYEKEHFQSLIKTQCKCGRFAMIVMSNYVTGNTLYAITYCSRCNKFYFHSGGSTLGICGELSYICSENEIELDSEKWNTLVTQINAGNIFAK